MMDNYDRTIELVDAAYNSAGAGQEQYEKTLDSLQSKLNMLANAWNEFITGISNSKLIKGTIDLLTNILTVVNNLTDKFGDFGNTILKTGVLLGGLTIGGKAVTNLGNKLFPGLIAAITGKTIQSGGDISKAGEFLGTTLLRSMTEVIRSDKTLASSFSDKFEGFANSFKRKDGNFKHAFESFSSRIKKLDLHDVDNSEREEFLEIINNLNNAYKECRENINEVNNNTEEGSAILQRLIKAQNAFNNSQILSSTYRKLDNKQQLVYNSLIQLGIGTKQADILMTNNQTKAAIIRASAEGKLTKELIDQQVAELELITIGSKLKNYTKLLFGFSKETRSSAAEMLGMTKVAADGSKSLSALGSAASAASLGWIALVAALIAAGIAFAVVYHNSIDVEKNLEKASKSVEQAKESANEAKDAYDNLLSTKNEYDDNINNINELIKGTKDWKEAIIENNKEVLNLLANYKELQPFLQKDSDGRLFIADEGWDKLLAVQEKQATDTLNNFFAAQINESGLKISVAREKANNKIANMYSMGYIENIPEGTNEILNDEGESFLAKGEKLLDDWDNFIEYRKAYFTSEETDDFLNNTKTELTGYIEDFYNEQYKASQELAATFNLLAESAGIVVDGVDNFSDSMVFADKIFGKTKRGDDITLENLSSEYYELFGGPEAQNIRKELVQLLGREDLLENLESDFGRNTRSRELTYGAILGIDRDEVKRRLDSKGEDKISYEDIDETILNAYISEKYKQSMGELADLFKQANTETANFITNILADEASNLLTKNYYDDFSKILDENGQVTSDLLDKYLINNNLGNLQSFAEKYGKSEQEVIDQFNNILVQVNDLYKKQAKTFASTFYKTGALRGLDEEEAGQLIADIGVENLQDLNNLITNLQSGLTEGSEAFNSAANHLLAVYQSGTKEDIAAIKSFINNINWESSIDSAYQLKKGIDSNNIAVKNLSNQLLILNEDSYSISKQFEEFFISDSFSQISEDIDDLIKNNDEISAKNIEELSESSDGLNKILKQDIASAGALAKAITLLKKSEISIDALTDRTWKFLNTLTSVDNLINKVHNNIEDFDEGIDTGEGIDFLKERYEKIQEYADALEYGNDQAVGSLEYIFGENIFDGLRGDELIKSFDQYAGKIKEWVAGDGYGFWQDVGNGLINIPGIEAILDENKDVVLDIANMTTDELVKAIAEGANLTEEAASMFLTSYISHSADMRQVLKENDLNKAIQETFTTETSFLQQGKFFVMAKDELEGIAEIAGTTAEKFKEEAEKNNKTIKIVDWFDDNTNLFKTGENFWEEINKIFDTKKLGTKDTKKQLLDLLNLEEKITEQKIKNDHFDPTYNPSEFYSIKVATTDVNELTKALSELAIQSEYIDQAINQVAQDTGIKLSKEIITGYENGVAQTKTIFGNTVEELEFQVKEEDISKTADAYATAIAEAIKIVFSGSELAVGLTTDDETFTEALAGTKDKGQDFLKENPLFIKFRVDQAEINKTVSQAAQNASGKAVVKVTLSYPEGAQSSGSINLPHGTLTTQEDFMKASAIGAHSSGTPGVSKTGSALTGEEGYEIAYNNGKAYLLGANGPEIVNLEKGTQIFNHEQSKAIIRRSKIKGFGQSFVNGTIGSYASTSTTGKYNQEAKDEANKVKGNSSSSKSSGDKDPYESALDIYHNFIVALSKLNNDLDDLVSERDKILSKESRALETGDVEAVAHAQKELEDINDRILKQQQKIVKENSDYISGLKYGLNVLENRFSEYNSVVDTSNGYINVNWEAYNNLDDTGKETVDDLISEWEDYNDRLEEAKDAIQEIIDYYYDLAEEYRDMHDEARDSFIDLINDLTDVLIEIDEKALERQQEYYDQLIEQDEDYLDALRKNVEERRKIRDRENSYEDLAEKQRRLSLLKRDTSGVYKNEIASLEKEIADSQQDLTDQKIDDIIDNMEEDLDLRKEQFDKHIELMEDNINQARENGEYARRAQELLEQQPEEAYRILTETNSEYLAMSSAEQAKYTEELKNQMIEMSRFMEGYYIRLAESMDAIVEVIKVQLSNTLAALGQNSSNINSSQIGAGAGPNGSSSSSSSSSGSNSGGSSSNESSFNSSATNSKVEAIKDAQRELNIILNKMKRVDRNNDSFSLPSNILNMSELVIDGVVGSKTKNAYNIIGPYLLSSEGLKNYPNAREWYADLASKRKAVGFSKGGIVDFTGPAIVHGSKSRPEAFLSAKDTQNIANLRDALKELNISNKPNLNYGTSNFRAGDCTIYINVDQIASDYDIDRAIEEVQRKILSSSSYRNINLINRMR